MKYAGIAKTFSFSFFARLFGSVGMCALVRFFISNRFNSLSKSIISFSVVSVFSVMPIKYSCSKYKTLEGVWRNTRFNANFATTFTAGKEWAVGNPEKHKTMGLNLRAIYTGGFRTTPIDVEASMAAEHTEYILDRAFEDRLANYFRTDVKFSLKRNRSNRTTTFALDIQNCTNNKNIYGSYFNTETGKVEEYSSLPLIPILSYKVEF